VTLAIGADPTGGTLAGTLTRTVAAGVASFGNLSITAAGSGYTLTATSSPSNGSTESNGFDVTPAAASQLAFTTQPASTTAGAVISPSVQVSVEDGFGNVVTSDNSTTVTLAIGTNPGGGTLSGTLTRTVGAGVASFNDLWISSTGTGYTLTATSNPAHGTAASSPFDLAAAGNGKVTATLLTTNSGHPCTSGASCTTSSVSPTAGGTLLILVQRGGSTTTADTVSSITGPISAATSVSALEYPLPLSRDYLFAWTATATGASGTVTVNFAGGSNANPTVVEVVELSSVKQSNLIAQQTTAASALLTATADLNSPDTKDGEVVLVSYLTNASLTTPPGFTALDTISTGSNGGENYGVYFSSSAQASTSITSGGLGLGWGTIAIELTHG